MKSRGDWENDIFQELRTFSRWAISALLDTSFIATWVILQWLAGKVITIFPLDGVDQIVLNVFQIAFAVTTLIPVLVYVWTDSYCMLMQARRRIESEKNHGNS